MLTLEHLGITREDILSRAVETLLSDDANGDDLLVSIKAEVVKRMVSAAEVKIDELLRESIGDIADAEYTPVDEFGRPTREMPTSLRRLVQERSVTYLSESVNTDGKTTDYNKVGSRAEWMAMKAAKDAMTYAVMQEIKRAVETAKAQVKQSIANHIRDTMLSR